ncbi:MAG: NitT/TauT family transport system ATP-binding protein [Verrucomicrobiota bacterium]
MELVRTVPYNSPIVELKDVSKWFGDARSGKRLVAIKKLNLVIPSDEEGEFVVLLGPSGCGKSTILGLISGLIRPDEGEVWVKGKLVTGPSPDSATVPQMYTCFPWLTAIGNVEFGLAVQGMSKDQRRRVAAKYLRKVGLEDRIDARPGELSGGMQQRVAIARTLAIKPPIVLMDEPFGALDAQTRGEMQQMLLQLWKEEKNTIIFVTHDISEALLLGDRVVMLSARPAHVVYDRQIDFPRPREQSLTYRRQFVKMSESLLDKLKP